MKVNTIQSVNIYPKSEKSVHPIARLRENVRGNSKTESKDINQINTTIKRNPDGRASFKGGAPLLHKIATFTKDNPLTAEAMFAILITCGLRPLTIMATAKNDEEKEKCSYQAAKSISSGLVGLAVTAIIATPIAMATKAMNQRGSFAIPSAIKEESQEVVKMGIIELKKLAHRLAGEGTNPELVEQIQELTETTGMLNLKRFYENGIKPQRAFLENIASTAPEILETVTKAISEQKVINNYDKTNKNIIDKFFQPIVLPLRAKITIAMVPIILGFLGKTKPGSKPKHDNNQLLRNVLQTETEKELFGTFNRMVNNEN